MNGRITAIQAAQRLGVKRETVYAYVSRGLLGSERALDGKTSTFDPAEVDRLRRRRTRRRPGHLDVPIATAVTEVADGRVGYRGTPLPTILENGAGFEEVAALLWQVPQDGPPQWDIPRPTRTIVRRVARALPAEVGGVTRVMSAVVAAGAADPFAANLTGSGVAATGRLLILAAVESLSTAGDRPAPAASPVARSLWARLTTEVPDEWPLLDTAMVLLADHGLATSTLAARLAASTRAAPSAVVTAALGVVSGSLHGGASRLVHRMLATAHTEGPPRAVRDSLAEFSRLPGVGHVIHRSGDPRFDLLHSRLMDSGLDPDRLATVAAVVDLVDGADAGPPNVDLALGSLTWAAGMGPDAGETVFAVARMAGWLAHAVEEYDSQPLRFRPQGRYVGPSPGSS